MGSLIELKQSLGACGKANCDELALARISNTAINNEHLGEPGRKKVNLIQNVVHIILFMEIYTRLYDEAIATLGRLYILPNTLNNKLALNATFKTSFRQALTGGSR
jgi:hypothetical protein